MGNIFKTTLFSNFNLLVVYNQHPNLDQGLKINSSPNSHFTF